MLSEAAPPLARPAAAEAATPPSGVSDAAEQGSAVFLKGVLAALKAENERLRSELDAQRAHCEALARSLAAARARSSRAQAPQAKVLSELIRLRRDFLTADRSVKQLQHETKMMRSAFQARVSQLGEERDSLLSAQQRMAEDGTRMAIEVSELKRQLTAQAAEAAADRVRSASQPARRASSAWQTPVRSRLSGASGYRVPATSPPMASLRERLEMRRKAREAEQSTDGDGESSDDDDDDDDADEAAEATSPPRTGLTMPAATPGSRALRPRTAQKVYTEPSLRAKMRRPRSPPKSARRRSGSLPAPPNMTLLGRAVAAAQALSARARQRLSPESPPKAAAPDADVDADEAEAEAEAERVPLRGRVAPFPSPLCADSASGSDSGGDDDNAQGSEEACRVLSFERGEAASESPPDTWADDAAELPPLASPFSAPPSPATSLPPALARPRRASFTNQPGAYREPSLVTKMRRNATT